MERVGVFVDAGYMFATGAILLAGEKRQRRDLDLQIAAVVKSLTDFAQGLTRLPLLRIYWYDGTDRGPTDQHTELAFQDGVKMRLGIVNRFGEQKGVDSLIVTDMINLARSGAIADAVLMTGDEDIRVGVQQAQEVGVRVHLVGIEPHRMNQSDLLLQEADTTHEWDQSRLGEFLKLRPQFQPPTIKVEDSATDYDIIDAAVEAVVSQLEAGERDSLRAQFAEGKKPIPKEIDRSLLRTVSAHLGQVTEDHRHRMRDRFREMVAERSLKSGASP